MQQRLKTQLKRNTLHLFDGMQVCWPRPLDEDGTRRYGDPQQLRVSRIIEKANTSHGYAVSDNNLIAIIFSGELYVAPETHELVAALEDAGLPRQDFPVPFSHGEIPQGAALDRWHELLIAANQEERQFKKARAVKAHKKQPAFKPAPATA